MRYIGFQGESKELNTCSSEVSNQTIDLYLCGPLHHIVLLLLLLVLDHESYVIAVLQYSLCFRIIFVSDVENYSFELEETTSETYHCQDHYFLLVVCQVDSLRIVDRVTSLDVLRSFIPGGIYCSWMDIFIGPIL